jgi:hypothetical protein
MSKSISHKLKNFLLNMYSNAFREYTKTGFYTLQHMQKEKFLGQEMPKLMG